MGIGFTQPLGKGASSLYDGGKLALSAGLSIYKGHSQSAAAECWTPDAMDHFAVWSISGKRVLMERVVASYWQHRANLGKDKQ